MFVRYNIVLIEKAEKVDGCYYTAATFRIMVCNKDCSGITSCGVRFFNVNKDNVQNVVAESPSHNQLGLDKEAQDPIYCYSRL